MRQRILPSVLIAVLLAMAGLPLLAQPSESPAPPGREVVTPSGLKYVDLKIGVGEAAVEGKILEVSYWGKLAANGVRFESSMEDHPFTFRLGAGDAIKGWDEGLLGMKVGGKRRLVIPPSSASASRGWGASSLPTPSSSTSSSCWQCDKLVSS